MYTPVGLLPEETRSGLNASQLMRLRLGLPVESCASHNDTHTMYICIAIDFTAALALPPGFYLCF